MPIARLKKAGFWIGLMAIALQIAFAPAFSMRALAMELDPLAAIQICITRADSGDGSQGSSPADHAGHCADCCMAACAAQVLPALAPVTLSLPLPRRQAEPLSATAELPFVRGPPRRDFPARGPPFLL